MRAVYSKSDGPLPQRGGRSLHRISDWTSSAYLGLRPGVARSQPVTTGRPAALGRPGVVLKAEKALAALVAQPTAWLAPSTLHLLFDLAQTVRKRGGTFLLERESYPLLTQTLLDGRGSTGHLFYRGDLNDLQNKLHRKKKRSGPLVVVTEGVSLHAPPALAPLADYELICREMNALLVVDDSQGIGLLGTRGKSCPFGCGGGGIAARTANSRYSTLVIASLAKSLGVPAAFAAGSARLIHELFRQGPSAFHTSPASNADAEYVLDVLAQNRKRGDIARRTLHQRIRFFQATAARARLPLSPGNLPLQSLQPIKQERAENAWQYLRANGERVLLLRAQSTAPMLRLGFVVRANHTPQQIVQLVEKLAAFYRH